MTPWVRRLVLANAAMFLLQNVAPQNLWFQLVLVPVAAPLRPWTVVTYMFLHGGLWHLVFNMLALWSLGPQVELRLGGRRFLGLYLTAGVVAAVASVMTPRSAVVGASGAVLGVVMAFAMFWPRAQLLLMGIIPMEARWLLVLFTGASLYFGYSGVLGGIAHFAHLGGILGGFLYLKWLEWRSPARRFRERAAPAAKPSADPAADVRRWQAIVVEGIHPLNREEVERLLAKADAHGTKSLTPDERAFLDRLSAQGPLH